MMKTFDELYNELQSLNNSELNTLWKDNKKENKEAKNKAIITCIIIDVLVLITLFKSMLKFGVVGILFTCFLIIIVNCAICAFSTTKKYFKGKYTNLNNEYKKAVIHELINNFYDNFEYFPDKGIPEYIYELVEYDEEYNQYSSEDYVEALIDNKYSIQMADVLTEIQNIHENEDGELETDTYTIFEGLFAKIVIDNSINGTLKIMQNGSFSAGENNLKMDYLKFEDYFDVSASDKILGMQILTSDVMEMLVDFTTKTNMKYDICIKDNEMYVRFHSGNMFEIDINKKTLLDRETTRKYFYMLNFTYNLSNKLIEVLNDL